MNHLSAEFVLEARTLFGCKNLLVGGRRRPTLVPFTSELINRTISSSVITRNSTKKNKQILTEPALSVSELSLTKFRRNLMTNSCQRFHQDIVRPSNPCGSRDRFQKLAVRMYSTDNRENGNGQRTEIKGVVFHIPHPIEWMKNLVYTFVVRGLLDSSFSRQEFLFGAKQAVCHLTRLAVLQDFDTMKLVASTEVISKMQEIVSALSMEQLQSIEILPENINLAKFSVSSISHTGEGSYAVSIDVFCLAVRMFRSQPLLIQTIIRFSRDYDPENRGDWHIASIQEFNIRELGSNKNASQGHPK